MGDLLKNNTETIKNQLKYTLKETDFKDLGTLYRGKVRDNYIQDDRRIIISTDRISSFDRVITTIPFKGQLLNQISAFWFEKTKKIANSHFIESPDPNVSIVRQCETIPIEIIVRAYITGTMWRNHIKGKSTSGIMLPDNTLKNQQLDELIITPSTKAETGHDIYISKEQILKEKIVEREIYEEMEEMAISLFDYGYNHCSNNGLILVDTKYEFGLLDDEIIVIDEIHTQDSSRFWIQDTYFHKFAKREEPESLDKEIFRGWLMKNYPDIFPDIKIDQQIPSIGDDIRIELAYKYISSYEMITGLEFEPQISDNINKRIQNNLKL